MFTDKSEGPAMTSGEAFLVMDEFILRYAERVAVNDLLTLVGDTDLERDGMPTDPAAWDDWLDSAKWILAGNVPSSRPGLK